MKKNRIKDLEEAPTDWSTIREETDRFADGFRRIFRTLQAANLAFDNIMAETDQQVSRPSMGKDGKTHLDEDGGDHLDEVGDDKLDNAAESVMDVWMIQELCTLLKLDPNTKSKTITAYINRHQNLHPLLPKIPPQIPQSPGSTQVSFNQQPTKPARRTHRSRGNE